MAINEQSRIERLIVHSKSLGKDMQVLVYLPHCYNIEKNFPTLYFLHGRSGNEKVLLDAGINSCADRLIQNREISAMIIVCPNIDNSRGLNSSSECAEVTDPFGRTINIGMYEDYFINEVIPTIDSTYKTISNRSGRFIGGASAGGYAALHNAFRHPDLFSKVGGHMPAIELQLEDEDKEYFKTPESWDKYDPIRIANNSKFLDLMVYLDAGDKDEGEFYKGCSILHAKLQGKCINSLNHIYEGHHNVDYIKSNMEKYLRFYNPDCM